MSLFNGIHEFYQNYTIWFFVAIFALITFLITTVIIIRRRLRKKQRKIVLDKIISDIKLTSKTKPKTKENEVTTKIEQTKDHTRYQPIQTTILKKEPIKPEKKPEQKIDPKKEVEPIKIKEPELLVNKMKNENDFVKPIVPPKSTINSKNILHWISNPKRISITYTLDLSNGAISKRKFDYTNATQIKKAVARLSRIFFSR